MITVLLYGEMGKRFGRRHKLDISTPAEAIRALSANYPEFQGWLYEKREAPFRVTVGREDIDSSELVRCTTKTLKFIPLVSGSGNFGKIIVGALLIYFSGGLAAGIGGTFGASAATITSIGSIITNIGISLVLSGLSGMLSSPPKAQAPSERPDNKPSYTFDGAVNTTAQGNCVPVLYGECLVGSQVISSGLSVEQI